MSPPNIPIPDCVAKATITATITIRVNKVAYTRERYLIRYRGVERDRKEKQSSVISGRASTTDDFYIVTLTGLKENTTYNYSVTAINCVGNRSSAMMTFRTLPEGYDQTNTTILPFLYQHDLHAVPSSILTVVLMVLVGIGWGLLAIGTGCLFTVKVVMLIRTRSHRQ